MQQVIQKITDSGIVAVVRHIPEEQFDPLIHALVAGGVRIIEVTVNTNGAFRMIRKLAQDEKIIVGAGTVLDAETARMAIIEGAKFIVSPCINPEVISAAHTYEIPAIPGGLTPNEILQAHILDADMVKIFPASGMGHNYIKELRGPLPQIPLMATGGISLDNVQSFFSSGVSAVGVGGALVPQSALKNGNWDAIRDCAREFLTRIATARGSLV